MKTIEQLREERLDVIRQSNDLFAKQIALINLPLEEGFKHRREAALSQQISGLQTKARNMQNKIEQARALKLQSRISYI